MGFKLILLLFSVIFIGCQSSIPRQPSSLNSTFDPNKVQLLKWAAQNKILFQIDDASFEHISFSKVDESCEKINTPAWSETILTTLQSLYKISKSNVKVHILDVKMGPEPLVSISQDLDGLTYLNLQYAENNESLKISNYQEIPCDKKDTAYIGKFKTERTYQTPSLQQIRTALAANQNFKTPERWKFKTDFLTLLAENMTLFRLTSDVSFEKSFDGQSLLTHFLNKQAAQASQNKTEALNYWLNEINQRSHSGSYLNLFTLKSDKNLTTGIATHQDSYGVAYPFMSYKIEDGQFLLSDLSKLESCLNELKMRYRRSLASIGSDLSTQSDKFLYPGYSCQESN